MSCQGFEPYRAKDVSSNDLEIFAKLISELALPLKRKVRWRHDQDAADETSDLQFLDQQARHDRLPGPGIVGEQKTDARQTEEVLVNRLELMRKRIDTCYRETEVGIVFIGETQPHRLDSETEARGISVEG